MSHIKHERIAGLGHVAAALVLLFGKAGYGGRQQGMLGLLADHPLWGLIHLFAGLALLTTSVVRMPESLTGWFSASVMGVWSVLLLWWATTLEPDATWLAGIFGMVLAAHSIYVADKQATSFEEETCG